MKKHFTRLCAAILTLTLSVSAFAAAPLLSTKVGGQKVDAPVLQTATVNPGQHARLKTMKTVNRLAGTSAVSLSKAVNSSRFTYVNRAMRKASAVVPELTGCVSYSNEWLGLEEAPVGLYKIPTSDMGEFELTVPDVECISGVEVNGMYYYMMAYDWGFYQLAIGGVYDLSTGECLWSSSLNSYSECPLDMTFDKSLSWPLVYGLSNNGETLSYYQFNEMENAITTYKVADLERVYTSLAVDAGGQLYAIDLDGVLYKLNKETGVSTLVGNTGFTSEYLGGCTIDAASGKMYRTLSNDAPGISGVIEIDLATGAGTLLYTFPNEEAVTGLYVSGEGVADDPNAVNPPYTNTFDSEADLAGFTIIDANNDNTTWFWTSATFLGEVNGFMRISYNGDMAMDDWLISVPLRLKAGETYEVSINAWTSSFDERVELCYGTEPTAAAMTEHIVTKNLGSNDAQLRPATVEGSIVPEKSGIYYIGIHGISDADQMYLNVDNLTVSAPLSNRVPASVENLSAEAAEGGVKSVTVSFDAPTLGVNGEPLSTISKIEVFRSGTADAIKTYETVLPGQSFIFVDNPEASGSYTYKVYAYNEYGAGPVASVEVFCGIGLPEEITTVEITEDATPGDVTLSWTAVTHDVNGLELTASDVTYSIYGPDDYGYYSELIASELTTTAYSFKAVDEGDQQFVQYAVCAVTEMGYGLGTYSDMIPVGTPYDGLSESFGDGNITNGYVWGIQSSDYTSWTLFTDASGVTSQDGDNGFIGMIGQYLDEWGQLLTGKVDLKTIVNPGLTFYVYNLAANDTNLVGVSIRTVNGEWIKLLEKPSNEINAEVGWAKVTVDLSAYADDVVQLMLYGIVNSYQYILFDRIQVSSLVPYNLKATDITAPPAVVTGASYEVAVAVSNEGTAEATGWSVELYADGALADTAQGEALASGDRTTVVFNRTMPALSPEAVTYNAKVVFAGDANTDDNETGTVVVTPIISKLPAVTDLRGESTTDGVKLSWTAPALDDIPAEPVTVDFEDGESFAQEYAGWTFVDVDNSPVGGFNNIELPGITVAQSTVAYFIFDTAYDSYNDTFKAHSGSKYLAALFRADDETTDDWAISPELSGEAQTISFYAKSYSSNYPERIGVYYSTGSLNTADFVKVKAVATVPSDWTLYTADLPAGAKYFAIRSCATGSFMLMVDDITYTPAGTIQGVEIVGYNVYRNGELITETPVSATEYTDTEAPVGNNTYLVTVVYNREESQPSNAVELITSGADAPGAGVKVTAVKGAVVIEGADGLAAQVAAADGRAMFSGVCGARTEVPLHTGVYVVIVNGNAVKVLVK